MSATGRHSSALPPVPDPGARRFRTVVFDCDSTLCSIEGVDELGAGDARVRELTELAMAGAVPLEQVYARRLALVQPDRSALERLARRYLDSLVPDAHAVVHALRRAGAEVHIVSGGLRPALLPLAEELGVHAGRLHAVDVRFDDSGSYAGFDEASPLARTGGKRLLLRSLAAPAPVLFVGDGATDMEARDDVDLFVAYGGVADRPTVTEAADVVLRSMSLAPLLPLALPAGVSDPADREVWERGLALWRDGALVDRRRAGAE